MREALIRARAIALLCFLYDGAAFAAAMIIAVLSYSWFVSGVAALDLWSHAIEAGLIYGLAGAGAMVLFGLHRRVWRFVTVQDAFRAVQATLVATLVFLSAVFLTQTFDDLPRPAPFAAAVIALILVMVARLWRRWTIDGDLQAAWRWQSPYDPPAVIVGRSAAVAVGLANAFRRRGGPGFRPIAIVEPDGQLVGRSIQGVPVVGGMDALEAAIRAAERHGGPVRLILTGDLTDRALIDQALDVAGRSHAVVSRFQADGLDDATRAIDASELLARSQRKLDVAAPLAFIQGKRVLVTGAGGTIGSEIVRQAVRLGPAALILLDASEYNLYAIDLEISETAPALKRVCVLADVRDRARVEEVFAREKPDVVFHAAALKHVPLMEHNPIEAILTNVGGTCVVAAAAAAAKAEAFVLISTDKAVNPTNMMGRSKRVAELYVQALAAVFGPATRFETVRFGNVLGSTGSVVPLFERQIARGGPVTVTHPEMTRYFMTVEEAAALVLQAAALNPPKEGLAGLVYVLDMGEPVQIVDLARQLIRLKGYEPERDIRIAFTGLRPGEKIHEEIFYPAEAVRPSAVDGVLIARTAMAPLEALEPRIDRLLTFAEDRDLDATVSELEAVLALGATQPAAAPAAAAPLRARKPRRSLARLSTNARP